MGIQNILNDPSFCYKRKRRYEILFKIFLIGDGIHRTIALTMLLTQLKITQSKGEDYEKMRGHVKSKFYLQKKSHMRFDY
jgi:hypothetical protein